MAAPSWLNYKNNAVGQLTSNLAQAATSAVLQAGEGAAFPSSFNYFVTLKSDPTDYTDTGEIVLVTGRSTDTLTITRAQQSTSDVFHVAGTYVIQFWTAGDITHITDVIDDMLDGTQPFSAIDVDGGAIDGAIIGANSAAAGTFTDLTATGNTTIGNASGDALTIHPAAWTLSNAVTITGTWTNLGTVTTVDINGGTVDGATIGGASAGAGTFAGLNTDANGTDVAPGSDIDADLITVGVTGAPKLWWDESDDEFEMSKGLEIQGDFTASGDGYFANGTVLVGAAALGYVGTTSSPTQLTFNAANQTTFSGGGAGSFDQFTVGTNHSSFGNIRAMGDNAGHGGQIQLLNGANTDDPIDLWTIEAGNDTASQSLHFNTDDDDDRMVLDPNGDLTVAGTIAGAALTVGSTGHNLAASTDGLVTMTGNARVSLAVAYDPVNLQIPAANNPAEAVVGVWPVLQFDDGTEEQVYATFIPPCDREDGTNLQAHVHWAPTSTSTGDVVWGVEWAFASPNSTELLTTAGTTQTLTDTGLGNAAEHLLTSAITLSSTGLVLDDSVGLRIFRDAASTADTLTGDASFISLHICYIKNKQGQDARW